MRTKILETVEYNRLTIIIGPTGCGKSTLISSLLREGLQGRIGCTQPRRLAVVSISRRVAGLQRVALGGVDVSYHVGNQNKSIRNMTALHFTTAGLLLEELRAQGVDALISYACVIIDECHERSPESDLVLVLIKKFMILHPQAQIRLVLMSATFGHVRYTAYFNAAPGCDEINCLTLETAESLVAFYDQVETYYLDDMKRLLWDYSQHKAFVDAMRRDPDAASTRDNFNIFSPDLLGLICSIVTQMDCMEDRCHPFLIFAPTYRQLAQVYEQLQIINGHETEISVLHSAVDIAGCMRSMNKDRKNSQRHIFLASAIADSSVTVPDVTVVIDLCRSLEVPWDVAHRRHGVAMVWSSQSVCDQRKGRTGRTCAGKVFRLVHQGFFLSKMSRWEVPRLTMSSCYNEVLGMLCARSYQADPFEMLASCLDPPHFVVAKDALTYLQEIGAATLSEVKWNQLEPSKYGRLLASTSLGVEESRVLLEGARLGLLHETMALLAIHLKKPTPIVHYFGEEERNISILQEYYPDVDTASTVSLALANLSAYIYWDVHWHQVLSAHALKVFERKSESESAEEDTLWNWRRCMVSGARERTSMSTVRVRSPR
jgi:ATP-dependent helicase HrpA